MENNFKRFRIAFYRDRLDEKEVTHIYIECDTMDHAIFYAYQICKDHTGFTYTIKEERQ